MRSRCPTKTANWKFSDKTGFIWVEACGSSKWESVLMKPQAGKPYTLPNTEL